MTAHILNNRMLQIRVEIKAQWPQLSFMCNNYVVTPSHLKNLKICFFHSQSNKTGMRFNLPYDFPVVTKPEFYSSAHGAGRNGTCIRIVELPKASWFQFLSQIYLIE